MSGCFLDHSEDRSKCTVVPEAFILHLIHKNKPFAWRVIDGQIHTDNNPSRINTLSNPTEEPEKDLHHKHRLAGHFLTLAHRV